MIYPKFPKAGSTIGICAPSAGIGSKEASFDLSINALKECGFETKETNGVRSECCPSDSAKARGMEFNSLFADDNIDLVFCASGGDYCIEMLPYIDRDLLQAKPKWFAGYSDPTAIEMYMTTVLDIATIYGVNAGSFDWRPLHGFQEYALSLMQGHVQPQQSYEFYSSKGFDEDTGKYDMDLPVKWELYTVGSGRLEKASALDVCGRLIGGCIDVIDIMVGTEYEDLEGFSKRYADDGLIWYFDIFSMDPLRLQYAMRRLSLKGLFDNAHAVVFGRVFLPGSASDADYLTELERVFGPLEVPIIWNADIGHTKPSFTVINGAAARLRYAAGRAELDMELK